MFSTLTVPQALLSHFNVVGESPKTRSDSFCSKCPAYTGSLRKFPVKLSNFDSIRTFRWNRASHHSQGHMERHRYAFLPTIAEVMDSLRVFGKHYWSMLIKRADQD
jgi:hypothetical protein